MKLRVLVVDDSRFFRRRVTEMLNLDPTLEVIDTAENGLVAIEKAILLKPDVITMDIEMPVMDGISAVRKIMSQQPTPVLMFSSLTTQGARATLDALEAGAVDFLPKKFEDISLDKEEARRELCARVRAIGLKKFSLTHSKIRATSANKPHTYSSTNSLPVNNNRRKGSYKLVAIGTSTGGPVALQQILTKIPADFSLPILIVQHMPASFTPAFAERLNKLCQIKVKEAEDGETLKAGTAYIAPGGRQMLVEQRASFAVIRIIDAVKGQTYKPCVDVTFTSISKIYSNQVLAIILTGMGYDGREGSRLLKQGGSTIWAQNEQTCVVFGMPGAVVEAGLADQVIPLQEISNCLIQGV